MHGNLEDYVHQRDRVLGNLVELGVSFGTKISRFMYPVSRRYRRRSRPSIGGLGLQTAAW